MKPTERWVVRRRWCAYDSRLKCQWTSKRNFWRRNGIDHPGNAIDYPTFNRFPFRWFPTPQPSQGVYSFAVSSSRYKKILFCFRTTRVWPKLMFYNMKESYFYPRSMVYSSPLTKGLAKLCGSFAMVNYRFYTLVYLYFYIVLLITLFFCC